MKNAPGCNYPIPPAGSKDWKALIAMFEGMAESAQLRADELTRTDEMRAGHAATASAYYFAALMIDIQLKK